MPKWSVSYRGGEVSATIEAKTEEDAIDMFLSGDCNFVVEPSIFHTNMVEVEKT